MTKPTKGTTAQCVKHYGSTMPPAGSRYASQARMPLAEFCGVNLRTPEQWLIHGTLPTGTTLIKLRFFLELIGYEVKELKELAHYAYRLAELMAFDVVTLEEARDAIGYKNEQDVYRLAIHGATALGERVAKIIAFCDEHEATLAARHAERTTALGRPAEPPAPASQAPTAPAASLLASAARPHPGPNRRNHDEEITTLGYLILALLPLAERAASDEFTPEERKLIRELTGGESVFRLSNAMNQLCGEEARVTALAKSHRRS